MKYKIKGVGMLRQWLNEDRITENKKMVTSQMINKFLSVEPVCLPTCKDCGRPAESGKLCGGGVCTYYQSLPTKELPKLEFNDGEMFTDTHMGHQSIQCRQAETVLLGEVVQEILDYLSNSKGCRNVEHKWAGQRCINCGLVDI